jgi:hypothetical protein
LNGQANVVAGSFQSSVNANFSAQFSLDIAVDERTPFSFEATTRVMSEIPAANRASYRLYTPGSNELDFSVSAAPDGTPVSGSLNGFLNPGVTYRLEFADATFTAGQSPFPRFGFVSSSATSRLVFDVPEPTSLALLTSGFALRLTRRRHAPP